MRFGPRPAKARRWKTRLRVVRLIWILLLGWRQLAAVAAEPRPVDVARLDTEQAKHVEIVSQKISADGRSWPSCSGRWPAILGRLRSDRPRLQDWVRITILGVQEWDVVRYQPIRSGGKSTSI